MAYGINNKKNNMLAKSDIIFIIGLIIILGGITFFIVTKVQKTGTQQTENVAVELPSVSDAALSDGAGAESAVKEFNITAKQWSFSPSVIEVKKGDAVTLNITSVDVLHGIVIEAFNVNTNLQPGKTVTVTFTADRTGSFPFFCSVICGDGHFDMIGKIVVTE